MKVTVDESIRVCMCCSRNHMRKTLKIEGEGGALNLGVTCAGLWFNVNLSGNAFRSAQRLEATIKNMSDKSILNIVSAIRQNAEGEYADEEDIE